MPVQPLVEWREGDHQGNSLPGFLARPDDPERVSTIRPRQLDRQVDGHALSGTLLPVEQTARSLVERRGLLITHEIDLFWNRSRKKQSGASWSGSTLEAISWWITVGLIIGAERR